MRVIVCENYEQVSKEAAKIIAAQVHLKPNCVLGLATGSTPVGAYNELVDMYKKGEIDFKDVKTFNLDEYYPIKRSNDQSYYYFMHDNLFNYINIPEESIHVLNGEVSDPEKECKDYEKCIEAHGGIDLQLLGIGRNGHIAFNEPDENLVADTHVTALTDDTIDANSRFFADIKDVPTKSLTMGMASIMKARKILILINGAGKAQALKKLLSGEISTMCPATMLNMHSDVVVICDKEAYNG
ncbi:MAG: glucosamine-6-phosphate deaminase [Clostridia bacterium]|nr:glucosamine-6-phosphate deaminase [Clostridia bacterium]